MSSVRILGGLSKFLPTDEYLGALHDFQNIFKDYAIRRKKLMCANYLERFKLSEHSKWQIIKSKFSSFGSNSTWHCRKGSQWKGYWIFLLQYTNTQNTKNTLDRAEKVHSGGKFWPNIQNTNTKSHLTLQKELKGYLIFWSLHSPNKFNSVYIDIILSIDIKNLIQNIFLYWVQIDKIVYISYIDPQQKAIPIERCHLLRLKN